LASKTTTPMKELSKTRREFIKKSSSVVLTSAMGFNILSACKVDENTKENFDLQIATFECDITPPLGEPIGLGFIKTLETKEHPLLAKGIVLKDEQGTYVICGLDWMEGRGETYDVLRQTIAKAAGTSYSRVTVHFIHQHSAPAFAAEEQRLQLPADDLRLLATAKYERKTTSDIALAIEKSLQNMQSVTHIGTSKAKIDSLASNRRVEREDGTILARHSSTKDSIAINAPVGLIDPWLRTVSFYNNDKAISQIHYYASHPQTFYGDARVSYDIVGMARERLQQETNVFQLYLTGAGGDIAFGKYNDGTLKARNQLEKRLYNGMKRSIADVTLEKVSPIRWQTMDIHYPQRFDGKYNEEFSRNIMADSTADFLTRLEAAGNIVWIEKLRKNKPAEMSCLTIGSVQMLHLPGEQFVYYQLEAQKMQPNSFVCVAAYGDCAVNYVGVDRIYTDKGGYEQTVTRTAPCEQMQLDAFRRLLAGQGE